MKRVRLALIAAAALATGCATPPPSAATFGVLLTGPTERPIQHERVLGSACGNTVLAIFGSSWPYAEDAAKAAVARAGNGANALGAVSLQFWSLGSTLGILGPIVGIFYDRRCVEVSGEPIRVEEMRITPAGR